MLPVVVLSGGLATRLRPVTEKIPKSLIDINGTPFVFHQLDLLQKKGIHRVHYCLGFLGEKVEEALSKTDYPKSMSITFSYDGDKLLGTGGAIRQAFPYISPEFFVTYGDSYLDTSFSEVENFYLTRSDRTSAVMVIFKNDGQFDKSNATFNKGALYYSKKSPSAEMNFIDYGLGILDKSLFSKYPVGAQFDLSDIYETLSKEGRLLGFEVNERFYEIGSFSGIEETSNYLKLHI